MQFEDILYENRNGVAWITINRPDKMNAFRGTTCDEIIKALNKAVQQAVADPTANTKMTQSGAEPKSSTPEELGAMLKADTEKWAQLIKSSNITGDE